MESFNKLKYFLSLPLLNINRLPKPLSLLKELNKSRKDWEILEGFAWFFLIHREEHTLLAITMNMTGKALLCPSSLLVSLQLLLPMLTCKSLNQSVKNLAPLLMNT